jgi:hypothetical protein
MHAGNGSKTSPGFLDSRPPAVRALPQQLTLLPEGWPWQRGLIVIVTRLTVIRLGQRTRLLPVPVFSIRPMVKIADVTSWSPSHRRPTGSGLAATWVYGFIQRWNEFIIIGTFNDQTEQHPWPGCRTRRKGRSGSADGRVDPTAAPVVILIIQRTSRPA